MRRRASLAFLFCFATTLLLRAAPPLPESGVPFRRGEIHIDGKAGDSGWENAVPLRIDSSPLDRENSVDVPFTEVRLAYDDTMLYVAFFCLDHDIRCSGTKRDDPLHTGDVVEIFLDVSGDFRRIWEVQFNASGLVRDVEYLFGGGETLFDADGLWVEMNQIHEYPGRDFPGIRHAAGFLHDSSGEETGWLIEAAFPRKAFASERVPSEIRVNFVRYDYSGVSREPLMAFWSSTVAGRPHRSPGRMGRLKFQPPRPEISKQR